MVLGSRGPVLEIKEDFYKEVVFELEYEGR